MGKNWRLRERYHEELVPDLLAARGVGEAAAQARLLARDLHDPFLMKDMEVAVERILAALAGGERIVIFADYDADGIPAAAVLTEFFRRVGHQNFDVYIPDRHNEAYGLNAAAIRKLAAGGAKLLISVDCGIANAAEIALANELGLAVIVTDHHLIPETGLPPALAVLNPKRADCVYPEKMLCGAGVAFKLVQALVSAAGNFSRVLGKNPQTAQKVSDGFVVPVGWEKWLLDLVAIATISDLVPLRGENRALAYFGLKVLRQTRRPGLLALYRQLKLDAAYLTEDDVAFMIGPRLNTAGRMSHASQAYFLLTTRDEAVAATIAAHLDEKNLLRRQSVDTILNQLGVAPTAGTPVLAGPILVAGRDDWSLGVLGLSAARVLENSGAPLSELGARLNAAYAQMSPTVVADEIVIDRELELAALDETFHRQLEPLAPFGADYPKPTFLFSDLTIAGVKSFGQSGNHLELTFTDHERGRPLRAIAFFNPFVALALAGGQKINLVASLEKSYFRSRAELRLRIVDLRVVG